jgi:hypothetical protein
VIEEIRSEPLNLGVLVLESKFDVPVSPPPVVVLSSSSLRALAASPPSSPPLAGSFRGRAAGSGQPVVDVWKRFLKRVLVLVRCR